MDDAGEQAMTRVRRANVAGPLAAIERQCIGAERVAPEGLRELRLQPGRAFAPAVRLSLIAPRGCEARGANPCAVRVALDFA
jgi:hypothetical protein